MELTLSKGASGEAVAAYYAYRDTGFYDRYVRDGIIVDFGYSGELGWPPLFENAVGIDMGTEGYDGRIIPLPDGCAGTIFASHVLEHLGDYGTFLRESIRILKMNGTLIISVPHKDVYERKPQPPSRFNPAHLRFYTPARLCQEVESQLDRKCHRIAYLEERVGDASAFSLDAGTHATFPYEISMVIEKIGELPEDHLPAAKRLELARFFLERGNAESAMGIMHKGKHTHTGLEIFYECYPKSQLKEAIGLYLDHPAPNPDYPHVAARGAMVIGQKERAENILRDAFHSLDQKDFAINCIYSLCHGRKPDAGGFNWMSENINPADIDNLNNLVDTAYASDEYRGKNKIFNQSENEKFHEITKDIIFALHKQLNK